MKDKINKFIYKFGNVTGIPLEMVLIPVFFAVGLLAGYFTLYRYPF